MFRGRGRRDVVGAVVDGWARFLEAALGGEALAGVGVADVEDPPGPPEATRDVVGVAKDCSM